MAIVKGAEEVIRKLQNLKKNVVKKAIRKGSRAGSKPVQQAAKALAPRRSGKLASGIKVRALPRSRKWTGTQVTIAVADGGVFYASFIEFGTKTKAGRQRIAPRRYLTGAFQAVKSSAGNIFLDEVKQVIMNEVGR